MKPLAIIIDHEIISNPNFSLTDHYLFTAPLPKFGFNNKSKNYSWKIDDQAQGFDILKTDPELTEILTNWTSQAKTLLSNLLLEHQKVVIIGCSKMLSYWYPAWKTVVVEFDQERVLLLNNHSFGSLVTDLTTQLLTITEPLLTWTSIKEHLQPITYFKCLVFSPNISPKKLTKASHLWKRVQSCLLPKKILINYDNGTWKLVDRFYDTKKFLSQLLNNLTDQLGIDLNKNNSLKLWINPNDSYQLKWFLAKIVKLFPNTSFVYETLPEMIIKRFNHLIFIISE